MNHRLATTALLVLATAAACTPSETPTPELTTSSPAPTTVAPSPTPTVTSEAPSQSPSPSPTSTLSPEQEAAQAAAVEYFRALNAVRSDPDADFQPLADATTTEFMGGVAQVIAGYRERGLLQVGENTYSYGDIGPAVEAGGIRSVQVEVCADSSASDMVDAAGQSAVSPDVSRYHLYQLDVVQVGQGWRVNGGPSEAVGSC